MYDDSLGVLLTVQSGVETNFDNTVRVWSNHYDPDSTNNSASMSTTIAVVSENKNEVPEEYALKQNYPNPFNPNTTIDYSLPVSGHVRLTVLDLLGRPVRIVVEEYQTGGSHSLLVDGSDLSSGVYLYRLDSGNHTYIRRMVLLK